MCCDVAASTGVLLTVARTVHGDAGLDGFQQVVSTLRAPSSWPVPDDAGCAGPGPSSCGPTGPGPSSGSGAAALRPCAAVLTTQAQAVALFYGPSPEVGQCASGSTPQAPPQASSITPAGWCFQLFDSHRHEYGDGEPDGASLIVFNNEQLLLAFLCQRFPQMPELGYMMTAYELNVLVLGEAPPAPVRKPDEAAAHLSSAPVVQGQVDVATELDGRGAAEVPESAQPMSLLNHDGQAMLQRVPRRQQQQQQHHGSGVAPRASSGMAATLEEMREQAGWAPDFSGGSTDEQLADHNGTVGAATRFCGTAAQGTGTGNSTASAAPAALPASVDARTGGEAGNHLVSEAYGRMGAREEPSGVEGGRSGTAQQQRLGVAGNPGAACAPASWGNPTPPAGPPPVPQQLLQRCQQQQQQQEALQQQQQQQEALQQWRQRQRVIWMQKQQGAEAWAGASAGPSEPQQQVSSASSVQPPHQAPHHHHDHHATPLICTEAPSQPPVSCGTSCILNAPEMEGPVNPSASAPTMAGRITAAATGAIAITQQPAAGGGGWQQQQRQRHPAAAACSTPCPSSTPMAAPGSETHAAPAVACLAHAHAQAQAQAQPQAGNRPVEMQQQPHHHQQWGGPVPHDDPMEVDGGGAGEGAASSHGGGELESREFTAGSNSGTDEDMLSESDGAHAGSNSVAGFSADAAGWTATRLVLGQEARPAEHQLITSELGLPHRQHGLGQQQDHCSSGSTGGSASGGSSSSTPLSHPDYRQHHGQQTGRAPSGPGAGAGTAPGGFPGSCTPAAVGAAEPERAAMSKTSAAAHVAVHSVPAAQPAATMPQAAVGGAGAKGDVVPDRYYCGLSGPRAPASKVDHQWTYGSPPQAQAQAGKTPLVAHAPGSSAGGVGPWQPTQQGVPQAHHFVAPAQTPVPSYLSIAQSAPARPMAASRTAAQGGSSTYPSGQPPAAAVTPALHDRGAWPPLSQGGTPGHNASDQLGQPGRKSGRVFAAMEMDSRPAGVQPPPQQEQHGHVPADNYLLAQGPDQCSELVLGLLGTNSTRGTRAPGTRQSETAESCVCKACKELDLPPYSMDQTFRVAMCRFKAATMSPCPLLAHADTMRPGSPRHVEGTAGVAASSEAVVMLWVDCLSHCDEASSDGAVKCRVCGAPLGCWCTSAPSWLDPSLLSCVLRAYGGQHGGPFVCLRLDALTL